MNVAKIWQDMVSRKKKGNFLSIVKGVINVQIYLLHPFYVFVKDCGE